MPPSLISESLSLIPGTHVWKRELILTYTHTAVDMSPTSHIKINQYDKKLIFLYICTLYIMTMLHDNDKETFMILSMSLSVRLSVRLSVSVWSMYIHHM